MYEVRQAQQNTKHVLTPLLVSRAHEPLSFMQVDSSHIKHPHNHALAIGPHLPPHPRFGDCDVKRVLIDTRSSVYILFFDALLKMELLVSTLCTIHTPLVGFTGQSFIPKWTINLPLTLGKGHKYVTKNAEFMILDV